MKGNAYWFFGELFIVHLSGADTKGKFSLVEEMAPPGAWTPLHAHPREDQALYVLEGAATFYLPGESFVIGRGESAYGPRNVPHTEQGTSSEPLRQLVVNTPAGFEDFIAAAGEPAAELTLPPPSQEPPDMERLTALAADHGIEILGPPGALP